MYLIITNKEVSKVGYRSSLAKHVGEGATPFPGLLQFTFTLYLIMLSVKQGSIKYHFLSLCYDTTLHWTQVSRASGEHSNYYAIVEHSKHYANFRY